MSTPTTEPEAPRILDLHLLTIPPPTTLSTYISTLSHPPLFAGHLLTFIHAPTALPPTSKLPNLLLLLQANTPLPPTPTPTTTLTCTLSVLLPPIPSTTSLPPPTPSNSPSTTPATPEEDLSSADLSVTWTDALRTWATSLSEPDRHSPISVLNLLRYRGPGGRELFGAYGREFQQLSGPAAGSHMAWIGNVRKDGSRGEGAKEALEEGEGRGGMEGWDDVAVVRYASVEHFAGMVRGRVYGDLDRRYKGEEGALSDSGLVFLREIV